jgi:chemotaxis protein MotA
VITMGAIGGEAADIGRKVAAALVGTFLGILMAYGVFQPLAQACEGVARSEAEYMGCIKTALLAFSRGDPPITAIEFARRNIEPGGRPSFSEMEEMIRARKGGA